MMTDITQFPIHTATVPALPSLGNVSDDSLFLADHAGTGRFTAKAVRNYCTGAGDWVGDGVADDTAAIQYAIDARGAAGGGVVTLPGGTYRITATLQMRAGVSLVGYGATIRQANGANLNPLISFNGYAASNAAVVGVTFDGNDTANTRDNIYYMLISSQTGTIIRDCTFNSCPGKGVIINGSGLGNEITGCMFNGVFCHAVQVIGPALFSIVQTLVAGNTFYNVGFFCISGLWADEVTVTNNQVISTRVACRVSTVGTALTWVSGTQFTGLRDGMVFRIQGQEYQIRHVNSATSVTLMADAGTRTNQAAVAGGGDCINFDTCRNAVITENTITAGMSIGIVIHNEMGGGTTSGFVIANNLLQFVGNTGIAIAATGGNIIQTASISDNVVYGCGGGAANLANSNDGIYIVGFSIRSVLVSGNVAQDLGAGVQEWGLYVDASVPAGEVRTAGNLLTGNTVGGAFGAGWLAYTPTLSAGAGSFTTASATGRYRMTDQTITFEATVAITANGSAAGRVIVGTPVAAGPLAPGYVGTGRADGVSGKQLQAIVRPGTATAHVTNYDGTYPGADGEILIVTGLYEAA